MTSRANVPNEIQDIVALWVAIFGEIPSIKTSTDLMLDVLVRHLPLAPPYGQFGICPGHGPNPDSARPYSFRVPHAGRRGLTDDDWKRMADEERRSNRRRRVFLQGKIVYPHNSLTADCTIRDLSAGGARISVPPGLTISDPCLIVVRDAVIHRSTTAWHRGDQAGLQFQSTQSLAGDIPLQFRNAQRIWVELMPRQS